MIQSFIGGKNMQIGTLELEYMRRDLQSFYDSPEKRANQERAVREILRRPELKGFPGYMDRGVLENVSSSFLLGKVELMLEEMKKELNSRA